MRLSSYLSRTLRDIPSETELISYQLALRVGLLRPYRAGQVSWLPLGERTLRQLATYFQQGIFARSAQPIRTAHGLAKEAEILAVTELAGHAIHSYKQLPQILVQTVRPQHDLVPRGGLLRLREYTILAGYMFHESQEASQVAHAAMIDGLLGVWEALELPVVAVGDTDDGQAFILPHPSGDNAFFTCTHCDYGATQNAAVATVPLAEKQSPATPLEKVKTPDCKTIHAVADFVGVPTSQTLKAVFFVLEHPTGENRFIFAVIRGDLDVNEAKLLQALGGIGHLRPATDDEIRGVGAEPGYASPIGLDSDALMVVVDRSVSESATYVVGANQAEYHYTGAVYGRDFDASLQTDIMLAQDGFGCAACEKGRLELQTGIELATTVQLGTRYSEVTEAEFHDVNGKRQSLHLTTLRVGLEHLLSAILETHHDDNGIIWPALVAPFDVYLIMLGKKDEPLAYAEQLYNQLAGEGFSVLYDDRNESPGVKFTDADLMGAPLRITVSDRSLKNGGAEVVLRYTLNREVIPIDAVLDWVKLHQAD